MSAPQKSAHALFSLLHSYCEAQYVQLNESYEKIGPYRNSFSYLPSTKITPTQSTTVTEKAQKLHQLMIDGQLLQHLGVLLQQGIARLQCAALSEGTNTSLQRLSPYFPAQWAKLYQENNVNVKTLIEDKEKVDVLSGSFQKQLSEVMPDWNNFAKTHQVAMQTLPSSSVQLPSSDDSAHAACSKTPPSETPGWTSQLYNLFWASAGMEYDPKNFLGSTEIQPIPSLKNLDEFVAEYSKVKKDVVKKEPPTPIASQEAEGKEAAATGRADMLTYQVVFERLEAIAKTAFTTFQEMCDQASKLSGNIDLAINRANATSTNSSFKGEALEGQLKAFAAEGYVYLTVLHKVKVLEHSLKKGVDYLTLPDIPDTDQKTIATVKTTLWTEISKTREAEQKQLADLCSHLDKLTRLRTLMEEHCGKIDRGYHHHRYQVSNIKGGYAGQLWAWQSTKVYGANVYGSEVISHTSSKMLSDEQEAALKEFHKNENEPLSLCALDVLANLVKVEKELPKQKGSDKQTLGSADQSRKPSASQLSVLLPVADGDAAGGEDAFDYSSDGHRAQESPNAKEASKVVSNGKGKGLKAVSDSSIKDDKASPTAAASESQNNTAPSQPSEKTNPPSPVLKKLLGSTLPDEAAVVPHNSSALSQPQEGSEASSGEGTPRPKDSAVRSRRQQKKEKTDTQKEAQTTRKPSPEAVPVPIYNVVTSSHAYTDTRQIKTGGNAQKKETVKT